MFIEKFAQSYDQVQPADELMQEPIHYEPNDRDLMWILRPDTKGQIEHMQDEPHSFEARFDVDGGIKGVYVRYMDAVMDNENTPYVLYERGANLEEMVFLANRLKIEDHELASKVVSHTEQRLIRAVHALGITGIQIDGAYRIPVERFNRGSEPAFSVPRKSWHAVK